MRASNALTRLADRLGIAFGSTEALLRDAFPTGTTERDGRVVGAWFGRSCAGGGLSWFGMVRRAAGGLAVLNPEDLTRSGAGTPVRFVSARVGKTVIASLFGHANTVRHMISLRVEPEEFESEVDGWLRRRRPWIRAEARVPLTAAVRDAHRASALALLSTLDPEAVRLVRTGGTGEEHLFFGFNPYQMFDATLTPGAPLRGVLDHYPSLWETFKEAHDRGEPLPDAGAPPGEWDDAAAGMLAGRHGVPPWVIPYARKVQDLVGHPGQVPSGPTVRLEDHLLIMASLPRDWMPDGREWDGYARVIYVLRDAERLLSGHGCLAGLVRSKGRWTEWHASLVRAAGEDAHLGQAVSDTRDVAHAFAVQVLLPALEAQGRGRALHEVVNADHFVALRRPRDASSSLLFSGLSLRSVLEASARWHARRAAIAASVAATVPPGRAAPGAWGKGLPDHDDGTTFVQVLTDDAQLAAEGSFGADADGRLGLSHCVGGYGGRCRTGRVRIVSLRARSPDGGWERLSTASLDVDGDTVRTLEHRGARNGEPPALAKRALHRYVSAFASGGLRVDRAALRPVPDPTDGSGYDWNVPGAWEAVLAAWAPVLPRRLRTLSQADWVRLVDVVAHVPGGPGWQPRHALDWRPMAVPSMDVR